jgi:hypothetical protein
MLEPGLPSPLSPSRRAIVAFLVLAVLVTIAASVHDRAVASRWTDALGLLLGGLGGTFIGEYLERFGDRRSATRVAWAQMVAIAGLLVAVIGWRELPAYCQLPVTFAMGVVIGATTVWLQRLRMRA